jgi:hypothetical protein
MNAGARDLRLDFFRGIALMMIFVTHIPGNFYTRLTVQNVGFSDAAEMFVLIAGMSAYFAFGRPLLGQEIARGTLTLYGRVWQLYVTHMTMFVVVLGISAYAAIEFRDETYLENLGFEVFVAEPTVAIVRAVTLTFLPNYLDILPLYIVLLAAIPLMALMLRVHVGALLAAAIGLYLAARLWQFNLPNFQSSRVWFFNPFAWQLLFVIGFVVAHFAERGIGVGRLRTGLTVLAAAYALFALLTRAPWTFIEGLEQLVVIAPDWLPPIDKTNLSLFRLADMLAKMWLVAVFVPPQHAFFETGFGRIMRKAGKHSLEIFSLGIILSVVGSVIAKQTDFDMLVQTAVNAGGITVMLIWAAFLDWKEKAIQRRVTAGVAERTGTGAAAGAAAAPAAPAGARLAAERGPQARERSAAASIEGGKIVAIPPASEGKALAGIAK